MNFKKLSLLIIIIVSCYSRASTQIFTEKDGIVKIEMESIKLLQNWELKSDISGYSGNGYITWTGSEFFGITSNGRMDYKIKISNPGTYKLKWYCRVGKGTDNTEHNDTWVKIEGAADFYGKKSNGNIVRPRGVCTNDCPAGSGADGYFKVYGAFHDRWAWHASTSDHDPHDIYARFDTPGIYIIKIAARSSWHLIDKMVLFNEAMANQGTATNNNTPVSDIFPFKNPSDTTVLRNTNLQYQLQNIHPGVNSITVSATNPGLVNSVNTSEIINAKSTLSLSFNENATGTTKVSLMVNYENDQTVQLDFNVKVINQINQAPTIDPVEDFSIDLTPEIRVLELTGISDGNDGSQNIFVTVTRTPVQSLLINKTEYTGGEKALLHFTPKQKGDVLVTVTVRDNGGTDLNGIDKTIISFTVTINDPLNTGEESIAQMLAYPNPATNILHLNLSSLNFRAENIDMLNMTGQKVLSMDIKSNNDIMHLDVRDFPKGNYILRFRGAQGQRILKIMLQ